MGYLALPVVALLVVLKHVRRQRDRAAYEASETRTPEQAAQFRSSLQALLFAPLVLFGLAAVFGSVQLGNLGLALLPVLSFGALAFFRLRVWMGKTGRRTIPLRALAFPAVLVGYRALHLIRGGSLHLLLVAASALAVTAYMWAKRRPGDGDDVKDTKDVSARNSGLDL